MSELEKDDGNPKSYTSPLSGGSRNAWVDTDLPEEGPDRVEVPERPASPNDLSKYGRARRRPSLPVNSHLQEDKEHDWKLPSRYSPRGPQSPVRRVSPLPPFLRRHAVEQVDHATEADQEETLGQESTSELSPRSARSHQSNMSEGRRETDEFDYQDFNHEVDSAGQTASLDNDEQVTRPGTPLPGTPIDPQTPQLHQPSTPHVSTPSLRGLRAVTGEARRAAKASVHPTGNTLTPRDAFGPHLSVSDHACYESSILPGTPLPGIAEEKKVQSAQGRNSLLNLKTLGVGSLEKESAGLPYDPETTRGSPQADHNTLLFRDGRRRIDMVVVWEIDTSGVPTEQEAERAERRQRFQAALESDGLQIEIEGPETSFDEKTMFMKVHAPWKVITRYAEVMNLKMPIKEGEEIPSVEKSLNPMLLFNRVFELDHRKIAEEPSFYRSMHRNDKEEQFVVKDRETFYTSAQRSSIVWEIMMRTKYDDTDKVGIRRLLSNQTYLTAFPLHEGRYDMDGPNGFIFDRRLLYLEWARAARCFKRQPLWLVRKYFGDKIALYFAWLGFYTKCLVAPSIVGLLCFLYGLLSMESDDNIPTKEICDFDGPGNITLCPLCDKACRYQKLGESCLFARLTYLFDNPATVFFAIFMSFWATTFLELWKRQQAVINWEWDLQGVEQDEEPRPEFEANVKTYRVNPVTRQKEPYLPSWSRCLRFVATGSTVLFMVVVVCCAVLGTIIYRISLVTVFHSGGGMFLRRHAKIFTSITAAVINLVIIMILTRFYHKLALWLTNLENPRTQTEYEDSFTFKIFVFEFMNFYSSLIYIAFFKGRFFVHPGDEAARSSEFLRLKGDVCDPAGCLSELCIQLAIIMVGKQCLNNFVEVLYPKFWNWYYRRFHKRHTKMNLNRGLTRWEEDYQLQDPGRLALFDEYLEMVLQYGFVTLFVAAFPLAPLFALLNNIAEIRLDAYKMVTQARRPLAERVEDIGAWHGILQTITYISVVSNAFVIAYTSDFIPRMVYKYKYSPTDDLVGYIDSSLSVFNTSDYRDDMGTDKDDDDDDGPDTCQYRGYRNGPEHPTDPYGLSPQYWHVFAARLAFVVVFEHIVFLTTGVMAYVIPDVPSEVRTQIQREKLLAKEAKFEHGLHKGKSEDEYDELLAALRERDRGNNSRFGDILRRGSWGRRLSRQSDGMEGGRTGTMNSSSTWDVP